MNLISISADGFKTLQKVKNLKTGPMTVLTGPNGAGKSNLIDLFDLLGRMARTKGGIIDYTPPKGVREFPKKQEPQQPTQPITITLTFDHQGQQTAYSITLEAYHGSRMAVTRETPGPPGGPSTVKRILAQDQHPSGLKLLDKSQEAEVPQVQQILGSIRVITHPFGSRNPGQNGPDPMSYCNTMAEFLWRLTNRQHPTTYRHIMSVTKRALPFLHTMGFQERNGSKNLRFIEKDTYESYTANQVSPGTIKTLAIITSVFQPKPASGTLLLLDEPETGLSPQATTEIAKLLRLAPKDCQVVVATKSPAFLQHCTPEEILVVDKFMNQSRFHRLPEEGTTWGAPSLLSGAPVRPQRRES